MELIKLPFELTVCKVGGSDEIDLAGRILFIGKTDEELSLVCETADVPANVLEREDGWRGFRVKGTLDFSLVGILSGISTALAQGSIGIFAISTYDTDYILVKEGDFEKAADVLVAAGYDVVS